MLLALLVEMINLKPCPLSKGSSPFKRMFKHHCLHMCTVFDFVHLYMHLCQNMSIYSFGKISERLHSTYAYVLMFIQHKLYSNI